MSVDITELALGTQNTPALSGAGLLGLVTTGMYDAPLSMYREYIQNAADAVAGTKWVIWKRKSDYRGQCF